MAWRIRWSRGDRQREFALMRQQVALWTDETGRLLVEEPPEGWVWATLKEGNDQGPHIEWHDPPAGVDLLREGIPVDCPEQRRQWPLESGDALRLSSQRITIEIGTTSVNGAPRVEFVDRVGEGYDIDGQLTRQMWQLHRQLAVEADWQRLLDELADRAEQWPGMGRVDGCGVIIWEGEGEFYHHVVWRDAGSEATESDGPRRPSAVSSLLTRDGRLLDALRDEQVVFRCHGEQTVDFLLPVGDEQFEGAVYLVGTGGETLEPARAWRLADLFGPAAQQLVRQWRAERRQKSLREENRYFRERERRHVLFKDLVCESEAMRRVYDRLDDRGDDAEPIWFYGEAGTGKELLARAVHHLGERREEMLIRMGCADFPRDLVDFELFGCVASELTGAVAARKGIFELAEGGTVFLDEVDCLSRMVQGKLARMVRQREVRRVGDAVGRPVDTRLVVSSHRDLKQLRDEGRFRADLYELLCSQCIEVPPLRQRREDILPLARIFLKKFADRYDAECRVLGEDLQQRLLSYSWPGNVRQLQTVMEAAVLRAQHRQIVEGHDLMMVDAADEQS